MVARSKTKLALIGWREWIAVGELDGLTFRAKALGLSVAGVDLLRSEHGPVVLEVNVSPGLQGIEGLTNIDVAEHIVTFAERLVSGEAVHPSRSSRRIS